MTDNKLDIFELLREVDSRNIEYFDSLEPAVQKGFAPVVAMRWFSSGSGNHCQLVNGIVNPVVFPLHRHAGLMYKLMVACTDGKKRRYSWVKKKGKDKSAPTAVAAIMAFYECSSREAQSYRKLHTVDDVVEMAEISGYDKEAIKKIKTELK